MCEYFAITRAAYYKAKASDERRDRQSQEVCQAVLEQRHLHPRIGTRKLHYMIRDDLAARGIQIGRDKLFDLLRHRQLLIKRRRRYAITTQSDHGFKVYSNLVKGWQPSGRDQLWVTDITYLRTRKGFVYLFLITDAYSRSIVGWHLSASLGVEGALKALKMALRQCRSTKQLIHHSDRGIQYCCKAYTDLLRARGIKISMAAKGDCYENAMAERINGILKEEYMLNGTFLSKKHSAKAVQSAIHLYTHLRPHLSLNMLKPAEVHQNPKKLQ